MAEVFAVDPDDVELVGKDLDFTLEVHGCEAAFAQGTRQCVGGSRQLYAGVGQFAHQAGHQHSVAGIIEFEFVNADKLVVAEGFDGLPERERAYEVGVFNERTEGLGTRRPVPKGGQKVGLADAEATVEVNAGTGGGGLLGEQLLEEATAVIGPNTVSESGQQLDRIGLAGLGGVRAVAVERYLSKSRRRVETLEEFLHGDCRCAGSQLFDLYHGGPFFSIWVPSKNTGIGRPENGDVTNAMFHHVTSGEAFRAARG